MHLEFWRRIGDMEEKWRKIQFHGRFLEYVGIYGKKWN
jgi:hypothetical protein